MNVAPSSISRQIVVLENQFGTNLFDRSANGITLTHAGKLVHDFARRVLLDYDSLRADIDDLRGVGRTMIRIAAIESLAAGPPLVALQATRPRFPNASFRILTLTASDVEQAVKAGTCDLGVTLNPAPDPELRFVCEINETLVLAVSPSHSLAGRASITMTDLVDLDLAIHETGYGVRRLIDLAFRAHGFAVSPLLSSSSLHVLKSFAVEGLGGAIITRGAASGPALQGQLTLVPITEPMLDQGRITLIMRNDRRISRALRHYIEEVEKALHEGDERRTQETARGI